MVERVVCIRVVRAVAGDFPLVLGVVLGFMVESNYRRSLLLSGGDHTIFLRDPVSLGLLATALTLLAFTLWRERGKVTPSAARLGTP